MTLRLVRTVTAACALVVVTGACSDSPTGDGGGVPPGVVTFEVVPATAWITTGATLPLLAEARDAAGAPVAGAVPSFESSASRRSGISTSVGTFTSRSPSSLVKTWTGRSSGRRVATGKRRLVR